MPQQRGRAFCEGEVVSPGEYEAAFNKLFDSFDEVQRDPEGRLVMWYERGSAQPISVDMDSPEAQTYQARLPYRLSRKRVDELIKDLERLGIVPEDSVLCNVLVCLDTRVMEGVRYGMIYVLARLLLNETEYPELAVMSDPNLKFAVEYGVHIPLDMDQVPGGLQVFGQILYPFIQIVSDDGTEVSERAEEEIAATHEVLERCDGVIQDRRSTPSAFGRVDLALVETVKAMLDETKQKLSGLS